MAVHNSATEYGWVAKLFHWLLALLMIGLLTVGLVMTNMENSPDRLKLYGLHKSTGIMVLLIVSARIAWRLRQIQPALPGGMSAVERMGAHAAHLMLYVVMVGMPLSGWAMSNAAGYPVSVYGLFTMPSIANADPEMRKFFGEVHELMGYFAIALIALHMAAAFWHQFYRKDGLLRRMWW